ncbi:hypothetical protein T10_3334 [Trichinella papuae]|uniref:Uncharacterized protein n=1 Tax=Trichinella papuae TaxID=268474 RepID=A0A0V1M6R3_9BILA|nr:hypothetical protein T10_5631 [Trichinella papuae]KRZ72907.1 hypothetical protein T10_3334 [Trichinella papuae]
MKQPRDLVWATSLAGLQKSAYLQKRNKNGKLPSLNKFTKSRNLLHVRIDRERALNRPSPELTAKYPPLKNKGKCEETSLAELGMQNATFPFTCGKTLSSHASKGGVTTVSPISSARKA